MRIDLFLDTVNLTKKRSIAQEMIAHQAVMLNNLAVKPSREVKQGDKITITYLKNDGSKIIKNYQITAIPDRRNNPKSSTDDFVREMA